MHSAQCAPARSGGAEGRRGGGAEGRRGCTARTVPAPCTHCTGAVHAHCARTRTVLALCVVRRASCVVRACEARSCARSPSSRSAVASSRGREPIGVGTPEACSATGRRLGCGPLPRRLAAEGVPTLAACLPYSRAAVAEACAGRPCLLPVATRAPRALSGRYTLPHGGYTSTSSARICARSRSTTSSWAGSGYGVGVRG